MKIQKKTLILFSFVVGLIFFGIVFSYSRYVRNKVLSYLKENFEFCQILKDKIFLGKGEFWMICNNRPFYAKYENGKVKTELNGWSFLKEDPQLLSELSICNFYKSSRQNGDFELIFYCKGEQQVQAKIYKFLPKVFELQKLAEQNFADILSDDIARIYSFLKNCTLSNFSSAKGAYESLDFSLSYQCDDLICQTFTDLSILPISPLICMKENLSNAGQAKISFGKSFPNCEIIEVDSVDVGCGFGQCVRVNSICDDINLNMIYHFQPSFVTYTIPIRELSEIEKILQVLGKYFILPPLSISKADFISAQNEHDVITYKVDSSIIFLRVVENTIDQIGKKTEWIK